MAGHAGDLATTWWVQGYMTPANFIEFETRLQRPVFFNARPYAVWRGTWSPIRSRWSNPAHPAIAKSSSPEAEPPPGHAGASSMQEHPGPPPTRRRKVYQLLDDEEWPHPASRWLYRILVVLIVLSVASAVLDTEADVRQHWGTWLAAIEIVCVALFTVEYLARVWVAVEDRAGRYEHPLWGRLRYMATPMAIVDLLAILPTYLAFLISGDFLLLRTLRILRILKITRYSPALATFEVVLVNERRSLAAAATILGVALLLASGVLHHLEGAAQPEAFGSIPAAMWWAIATLTTVGYGDVVPVTTAGRIAAGFCAVIGIGMFALPTAILGAGFAHELQKRNFAATAAMIARVPLVPSPPPAAAGRAHGTAQTAHAAATLHGDPARRASRMPCTSSTRAGS